jgi:DNA-binding LacI/PurR family transcriptional regulator
MSMAGLPISARRRATISQVAELAGVSKATVSKAFNNRGGVSDETQGRVCAAGAPSAGLRGGPAGPLARQYRTDAFLGAVAAHGFSVLGIARTDFSAESGYRAMNELLGQRGRPTVLSAAGHTAAARHTPPAWLFNLFVGVWP